MHAQYVHGIVMAFAALGHNPVTQIRIINNMVGTDQPGQIERFAGCVQGDGAVFCVLVYRLGGNMAMSVQQNIGPDFIGNNDTVIGSVNFHGFFQFFPFPDSSAGIVGTAENSKMNLIGFQFGIHVFIVHAPYAVFILL